MADTHSVMPKKLAHALMEAGVQHFDIGGVVGQIPSVSVVQGLTSGNGLAGGLSNLLGTNNNFQAQAPQMTSQNFIPQITEQQKRQTDIYNQQQNLAQALLGQSQGQGPNPAQAQLAQQTGNNAAMQGALMASQRGASANPALIARQAAMQGAQAQQMGVGQAATLQAQQQLAAQQALAQQQQAMASNALQGENIQQGGAASQNNAAMGGQNINAQVAEGNQKTNAGLFGGLLQSAGAAFGLAEGGDVPGQAEVKGNSEKNDKVPAMLSPGEVVLPRSVTQGPDMEKKAIEFLRHLKGNKKGYGEVADAKKNKLACGGYVK